MERIKGDLIIETPFLFSFEVNEKKSQETDKLVGFSIPVCLWGKDGQPNENEKAFFKAISKITKSVNNILKMNTARIQPQL